MKVLYPIHACNSLKSEVHACKKRALKIKA